jgi:hypothetical protein
VRASRGWHGQLPSAPRPATDLDPGSVIATSYLKALSGTEPVLIEVVSDHLIISEGPVTIILRRIAGELHVECTNCQGPHLVACRGLSLGMRESSLGEWSSAAEGSLRLGNHAPDDLIRREDFFQHAGDLARDRNQLVGATLLHGRPHLVR